MKYISNCGGRGQKYIKDIDEIYSKAHTTEEVVDMWENGEISEGSIELITGYPYPVHAPYDDVIAAKSQMMYGVELGVKYGVLHDIRGINPLGKPIIIGDVCHTVDTCVSFNWPNLKFVIDNRVKHIALSVFPKSISPCKFIVDSDVSYDLLTDIVGVALRGPVGIEYHGDMDMYHRCEERAKKIVERQIRRQNRIEFVEDMKHFF